MMKVSILIPTYNASNFIRETLDSIFHQDYSNYEVIIVDDGSTDGTADILKSYGNQIRWVIQNHHGQAAAINRAIEMSRGEYLAYFDADDIMLPSKISVQAAYLDTHPCTDFVYSDTYYQDNTEISLKKSLSHNPFYLLQYCYILRITVMHRRSCIEKVGMFNESISGSDDWDMWVRMSEYCKMAYIKQPLSIYRIHGKNTSFNRPGRLNHYRRARMVIVKDACERRGRPTWLYLMSISTKIFWIIGRIPFMGEISPRFWLSVAAPIQRGIEKFILGGWAKNPGIGSKSG